MESKVVEDKDCPKLIVNCEGKEIVIPGWRSYFECDGKRYELPVQTVYMRVDGKFYVPKDILSRIK